MLLVTGCRFMFHGFVEINFQRWGYMRKAFLPDFSLGKPSRNAFKSYLRTLGCSAVKSETCCSVSIIFGISIQRGIFLLMIRCESITSLTVSHCIVTGYVVHSSIELFSVNEFGFDVFVTVSADNASFCCS